jgi:hypothetical protein
MADDQTRSRQRSSAPDDTAWTKVHDAIETLVPHRRIEIARRLDELPLTIATRDMQSSNPSR